MPRRRVLLAAAAVLVLAAAGVAIGRAARSGGGAATQGTTVRTTSASSARSYAKLVAANYKTLSSAQSTRLLRYAEAAYRCMSKQVDIGKPEPQPTKIVLALPEGTNDQAVARVGIRCAATIGDPPPGSSFQTRGHAVLLYLPKYCILDKKVEKAGSS